MPHGITRSGGQTESGVNIDFNDVHHQHVRAQVKQSQDDTNNTDTDQSWWHGEPTIEPLDGHLAVGDRAYLMAVTVHLHSLNFASAGNNDTQLNVTTEISLSDYPEIASREYNNFDGQKFSESGPNLSNENLEARIENHIEMGEWIIWADRIDTEQLVEDETNGIGAGGQKSTTTFQTYIDLQRRFGSPVPMTQEDNVYVHWLTNEDGVNQNYSWRVAFTLHWIVIEGDEPDIPDLFGRADRT